MHSTVLLVMIEAALRALAAAAVVWAVLRLLRVHNVPAQKAAWSLVLIAALAMPFAMRWRWLPAAGIIRLPVIAPLAFNSTHAATLNPSAARSSPGAAQAAVPAEATGLNAAALDRSSLPLITGPSPESAGPANAAPNGADLTARHAAAAPQSGTTPTRSWPSLLPMLAWLFYLAVTAVLLLRLMAGIAAALRLWFTAQPVPAADWAEIAPGARVRSSTRVSSPVNIVSGIVLPADFRAWEPEKLRIVLAHERSHVRQGDFYLHLFAGLYAALFWFSPLGWWLKRKLSELGEAVGDRAGLQQAASRSAYARLLLEFAAQPHPTLTGVAMARTRNLTVRIERLLNDANFCQAFAAGRRRAVLGVLLVPAVLFASAAQVRVQAAGQTLSPADPAQLTSQEQTQSSQHETGVSRPPDQSITTDQTPTPSTPTPSTPTPAPAPSPASNAAPSAALAPSPDAVYEPPVPPQSIPIPPMPPMNIAVPPIPPIHIQVPPMPNLNAEIDAALSAERAELRKSRIFGEFPYDVTDGGDAWALVQGQGQPEMHVPYSQQSHFYGGASKEIDKARKMAHGPFLWFEHNGESYIVDDPAVVAQIEATEKPIKDLRSRMRAFRDQQHAFSQQMREQARHQRQVEIPKPDLSREMAELDVAVASLKASQGSMISQRQLVQLQLKIAVIQRRLGSLASGFYVREDQWGAAMGKLGAQEGKLGAEQGRLGAQMVRTTAANQTEISAIIAQSLRDGKAKPVQ